MKSIGLNKNTVIGKFSDQFHMDPCVIPVVQKQRPIPSGLRDKVEEHLKELLENDIIEGPLDSTEPHEWVSNAMITRKKESGQIRLNVDMRRVNLAIKPTHCALPTVNELRHQLNGQPDSQNWICATPSIRSNWRTSRVALRHSTLIWVSFASSVWSWGLAQLARSSMKSLG